MEIMKWLMVSYTVEPPGGHLAIKWPPVFSGRGHLSMVLTRVFYCLHTPINQPIT